MDKISFANLIESRTQEIIGDSLEVFGPEDLRELGYSVEEIAECPYIVCFETKNGGAVNLPLIELNEKFAEEIADYIKSYE